MSLHQCPYAYVIDEDCSEFGVVEDIADVLIAQCVVDGDGAIAVENARHV